MFTKCYKKEEEKITNCFHLTLVKILGGGEAKVESGHTFLQFLL